MSLIIIKLLVYARQQQKYEKNIYIIGCIMILIIILFKYGLFINKNLDKINHLFIKIFKLL